MNDVSTESNSSKGDSEGAEGDSEGDSEGAEGEDVSMRTGYEDYGANETKTFDSDGGSNINHTKTKKHIIKRNKITRYNKNSNKNKNKRKSIKKIKRNKHKRTV